MVHEHERGIGEHERGLGEHERGLGEHEPAVGELGSGGAADECGRVTDDAPRPGGRALKRAAELRAIAQPHHNCAQSTLIPFAEASGLTYDQAYAVAQAFGGGMQTGGVCGAVTGALMALGLAGRADRATVAGVFDRMRQAHGAVTCSELLAINAGRGGDRHRFCDSLVFEMVALVEGLLG